MKTKRS